MTDNGEDFEKLRRLLALKRHEQPPPGYFNRLPDRITARIEIEEAAPSSSWWGWLAAHFDARPLLACTCGVAIGGLMLTGFQISQTLQSDLNSDFAQAGAISGAGVNALAFHSVTSAPVRYDADPAGLSSINPVFEPLAPDRPYQVAGYSIQRVAWGGSR